MQRTTNVAFEARPTAPEPAAPSPASHKQLQSRLQRGPTDHLGMALGAFAARSTAPLAPQHGHVIVVFGVPAGKDGAPTPNMMARVRRAAQAAQEDLTATLVVTGGAVANRFSEARTMAAQLRKLGVDAQRIYVENEARSTVDNAALSVALLRERLPQGGQELRALTVVTEPYHAPRALRSLAAACEQQGLAVRLQLAPAERLDAAETAPQHRLPRRRRAQLGPSAQAALLRCIDEKSTLAKGW